MNYYYLSATLPLLSMDEEPPYSQSEFLQICENHLSHADFKILEQLCSGKYDLSSSFVREWIEAETQFRNAIARKRSEKLGTDPDLFTRATSSPLDTYVEKAVDNAYSQKTPLERESSLDNFRWKQLDELSGFDIFTSRAIFAYALKLQIAARWTSIKDEAGAKQVDKIVSQKFDTKEDTKGDGGPEQYE